MRRRSFYWSVGLWRGWVFGIGFVRRERVTLRREQGEAK